MKKVVILLAIASLVAAPAFAGIRYSKHDLSTTSGTSYFSDNVDELCVFCHTPHGGTTGGFAPLWNRSGATADLGLTDLYNSATLDKGVSNPTEVRAAVNLSDAKLCLTCHDGGSLGGGLLNPPASADNDQPTFGVSNASRDEIMNDTKSNANLYDGTSMLTNDHPIGMNYTSYTIATEFFQTATAEFADGADGDLPLYSGTVGAVTYTSVMWCSTCHDVHNPDKGTPFLNTSNDGSAMCLTCHNK